MQISTVFTIFNNSNSVFLYIYLLSFSRSIHFKFSLSPSLCLSARHDRLSWTCHNQFIAILLSTPPSKSYEYCKIIRKFHVKLWVQFRLASSSFTIVSIDSSFPGSCVSKWIKIIDSTQIEPVPVPVSVPKCNNILWHGLYFISHWHFQCQQN